MSKLTTSISLVAGLARKGKKVLLIEPDAQANASEVLLPEYPRFRTEDTLHAAMLERKPLLACPTNVDDVSIVTSHILLSNTDIELTTGKDHRVARLRRQLEATRADYDVIILDCPPALSWLTIDAFSAVDKVLVVVAPGYFELDSTLQIGKTIAEVIENFNAELELAGFLCSISEPIRNTATSLKILRQTHGNLVYQNVILWHVEMKNAHMAQQDVFANNPRSTSAKAYEQLIKEVFGV